MLADDGLMLMELSVPVVPVTVTAAWPDFPADVATTAADPAPTAVAYPALVTVTTAVFVLDHTTVWPASVLPLASFTVALNCAL
jgi:hypothetical protein